MLSDEHTRVKLKSTQGIEGSDFISANWINVRDATNLLIFKREKFQAVRNYTLHLKVLYKVLQAISGGWFGNVNRRLWSC